MSSGRVDHPPHPALVGARLVFGQGFDQRDRAEVLVVVIVSRTAEGRVEISDGLKKAGVVSGEDLDGLKARILLTVALGVTRDPAQIQKWFSAAGGVF